MEEVVGTMSNWQIAGHVMEFAGIAWTLLAFQNEFGQLRSATAKIAADASDGIKALFRDRPTQHLEGELFQVTITSPMGVVDQLNVWPSDLEQQIAWLKNRIDTERDRVDALFVETMKKVGDAEGRANQRADDIVSEISSLTAKLVALKDSHWLPRLGGTLVTFAGVTVTVLASYGLL